MDAALALEKAKGMRPGNAQGNAFNARLVARQVVQLFHCVLVARGPAGIHAQQHFGPVLRLCAASAGVDFKDGVLIVFLAGKQHDKLGFVQQGGKVAVLLVKGFQSFGVFAFRGQGQPFVHVVMAGLEAAETLEFFFKTPLFLQNRGQRFGIVPCAGAGNFVFDVLQALLAGGNVKDAPRGWRNVGKGAGMRRADH